MCAYAALLTARAPGAIAVIAVAGAESARVLADIGARPAASDWVQLVHLAHNQRALDDALLVPRGAERFELHLHGGPAVVSGVLQALEHAGCTIRPAEAADAFPASSALETAVLDALPEALTDTAVNLLAQQPGTGLGAWARKWTGRLAAQPTGPLTALHTECQWLLDRAAALEHLLVPARVALIGAPSVGKSSLANALLGRPVAITSATPGTTRDWVEAQAIFTAGGVRAAVTLVDTAGLRDTSDPLETASIGRTHEQVAAADVVLFIVDRAAPLSADILERAAAFAAGATPTVFIANKADLPSAWSDSALPCPPLEVSALTHHGLEALMRDTLAWLGLVELAPDEPWLFAAALREKAWALACTDDAELAGKLLVGLQ